MAVTSAKLITRNLDSPDELREFDGGKLELVRLGGVVIARATFQPGWRWSKDVGPRVNTATCQAAHTQYVVSGMLRVRLDDGSEIDLKAGDAAVIPPGHDAWVVGGEPCIVVDFTGMVDYAVKSDQPEMMDFD